MNSHPPIYDKGYNLIGRQCWTGGMILTTREHGEYTVGYCNKRQGHEGPHRCNRCGADHFAERGRTP